MSIEEISLDAMVLSESVDINLIQPQVRQMEESMEQDDDENDDMSSYENRYAHNTKEEVQEKIKRRLSKLKKLLKRNILRKLSPLDLIKEQSKKIENMIEGEYSCDLVLDETEVLVFYMDEILQACSIVGDINVDLSELNEAYKTK
jgi:hypothetical protein